MAINLSEGSIELITAGKSVEKPVLQVSEVRVVNPQNNPNERYRLLLSDGCYLQQGMLVTLINDLVRSGRVKKGSIVQLTEFVTNNIQNRMIIIIVNLDLIREVCDIIGSPKPLPPRADGKTIPTIKPSGIVHSTISESSSSNPQYSGGDSLGRGLIPNENAGVGSHMQPPGLCRNSGPHSYNSYTASKTDPGQYNQTTVPPEYPKPDSAAGISRPPLNSHLRPIQPLYPQLPSMYANRGPISKNDASPRIIPIAALNPNQGRWTIKGRVTAKGELRHYSNQRGEGKVFSFDLLDSAGGEIRATCFNAVADQFYHQIEDGKIYLISKGTLRPAQKNFNHLRNDHEIMLDYTSTVQPCVEDDNSIPYQQFQFRSVIEIENMETNSILDVIGVLCSISPSSPIMRKNGTETCKRSLHIKDMSGRSVEITLWGNFCNSEGQTIQNMCDSGVFPVLAVKSVRVNDFYGKAVGTIPTSKLLIEPDIPEARRLKAWAENEGKNVPIVPIAGGTTLGRQDVRKTILQIKDEKLGTSEKPDWITVSATLSYLKTDTFCYSACPLMLGDQQCNKKVINNGDGKWRCERCDQSVDECDYRYILQFQIQDHTGLTWVTAFQEFGEEIFGISAKELYYLKYEEQDDERFAEIMRKTLFNKYIFKLKVKEVTFNDEQRVQSTVVKAEKLNFITETRSLLDLVDKLKVENPSSLALKSENVIFNSGLNNVVSGNAEPRTPVQPVVNYIGNSSTAGQGIGLPASQVGQYDSQSIGSRLPSTGPTGVFMSCSSCGGMGHGSTNCPRVMDGLEHSHEGGYKSRTFSPGSGSADGGGGSGECFKCHQHGHWARDCPITGIANPNFGSRIVSAGSGSADSGSGGGSGECFKCHKHGHWARDCPNAGSANANYGSRIVSAGSGSADSGSGGGSGECFKCHKHGHWARDCPNAGSANANYGTPTFSTGSGSADGGGAGGGGECFKCHQHGHWARDCPGSANPNYGSGNVLAG